MLRASFSNSAVILPAIVFFQVLHIGISQVPEERAENCGSILSSVVAVCSHPTLSRPDWCCNELGKWNNARCWCETNGFDALDTVAGTGVAFSFRDSFCLGSFRRPARGNVPPTYATCPSFDSIDEKDEMEKCAGASAVNLRAQRIESLNRLRDDKVTSAEDLSQWFSRMDELYAEEAMVEIVGLFLGQGRYEVKQYFMSRQGQYGFIPITADTTRDHFWRNPRMVSYTGGAMTDMGYFTKREFVTFERCSARIEAIYIVEDNYQNRYRQYWDPRQTRLISRYEETSEEWCSRVSQRCLGTTFPFTDEVDCLSFYSDLIEKGKVTCNRFEQAYIPQYAMHGNTTSCRNFYLDLASVDPNGACPAVGRESTQGRCGETQCPGASYINPFALSAAEPQFEETATHICSASECAENWPSDAQIESIPVGQRDQFAISPLISNGSSEETNHAMFTPSVE